MVCFGSTVGGNRALKATFFRFELWCISITDLFPHSAVLSFKLDMWSASFKLVIFFISALARGYGIELHNMFKQEI